MGRRRSQGGNGLAAEPATTNNDRALTLERGLDVLELLGRSEEDLSVAMIAKEIGIHRQAVYRLIGTLERRRLAVAVGQGRFRLGLAAAALGGDRTMQLQVAMRPRLRALSIACRATAFLAVAELDECVALAVTEPPTTTFHITYRLGSRLPLDPSGGAAPVAILAGRAPSPDDPVEVSEARQRGYSVSRGVVTPGGLGIAAPIAVAGAEACIGVVALDQSADVPALGTQLLEAVTAARAELA